MSDAPSTESAITAETPQAILSSAMTKLDLRYHDLGDDGEWFVILGHPHEQQVLNLAKWRTVNDWGNTEDEAPSNGDLTYTWARMLTACPDHVGQDDPMCRFCNAGITAQAWWMDWGKRDDAADLNKGKPGYFPVVVVDTGW